MKKFSPFLLVIVVLVLALAALGVGYGLWYENLTLDGTVNTGTVDVSLGIDPVIETVWMDTENAFVDENTEAKDVGSCTADNGDPADLNALDITVSNMYPGYKCVVPFTITSDGTIPVHLDAQGTSNLPGFFDDAPGDGIECSIYDDNGALVNPVGALGDVIQLHTDYELRCEAMFAFTNEDTTWDWTQQQEWTFHYDLQAHQYNEDANFLLP